MQSSIEHQFEKIFHLHKDRIYNFALSILKFEEAAQEVTQEIMIKLWLCREMLDQVENLDAYIYVIARNKSLNHLRKGAYDVRLLNELKSFMPDTHSEIDERMAVKDYEFLVSQALAALSPQRRKVYQLSRADGLNHEEIAKLLQLSKNTVKNHLVEALKQIRLHLNKSDGATFALIVFLLS